MIELNLFDAREVELTNNQYHSKKEYLSASGLKKFAISPAHYKAYLEEPFKETEALVFGSAVHAMIEQRLTGEPVFDNEFFIFNELDEFTQEQLDEPNFRRKKIYQEWKKEILLTNKKAVDISCKIMVDKLFMSRDINMILDMKKGKCEPSYLLDYPLPFIDNDRTVKLRTRPDYINLEDNYIVDYKTFAKEVTDQNCFNEITYRYYWLQAALYTLILNKVTGKEFSFYFIFMEKTPPYDYNIILLDRITLFDLQALCDKYLSFYSKCLEKNEWPGVRSFNPLSDGVATYIPKYIGELSFDINIK